jgi:preprotein translocase subunit SecD
MTFSLRRALTSGMMIWFVITGYGVYFLWTLKSAKRINFGIDLVGGTYLTLDVQIDKLFENELVDRVSTIAHQLEQEHAGGVPVSRKYEQGTLVLTFDSPQAAQKFEAMPLLIRRGISVTREGAQVHCSLTENERTHLLNQALESNISVIKGRVDQFGVGETLVARHGEKSIIVELPNVQDSQKAKAMIGTSALLEVKAVLDVGMTEQEILQKYGSKLPDDTIVIPGRENRVGGIKRYYLVPKYADLTGKYLKSAEAVIGGKFGFEPIVRFEFNAEGGDKFYELTSRGTNPLIAMILDGEVITAATAREPLRTTAQLEGNFSEEDAKDIAKLLRSGAFMAPVTFEEDRTIGPSLGAESITKGVVSCAIGMALLLIFSILVYKVAGILAFIVLMYNLLLILFALSLLGATLTLPGIAGMVLTVGMAIDASILIYERIREELALGKPFRLAAEAGFKGARVVILDANITHLIAAIVLYKLGAGPIQGFAATMMVGIVSTLITGLIMLRTVFHFVFDVFDVKVIKIR